MGRSLAGPEYLETRTDRLPRSLVSRAGGSVRAAAGRARPRQPAGLVRCARCAAADPLRRPSGYRAGRRHDDSARSCPRSPGTAFRAGLVRRQGLDGGDAVGLRPAGPGAAAGLGIGAPGLHGRRRVHAHRLIAAGGDDTRGRAGDRRRADLAQPGPLPQRGAALEDPHQGRRLPQLDPAPGRERHLPDGPGPRRSSEICRHAGRIDARPDSRPAHLVGRSNRGGTERQCRSRLVRDRGRSPADSRRRRRRRRWKP